MQDSGSFFHVCKEYFANTAMLPLFVIAVGWFLLKWNKEKKHVFFIAVVVSSIGVFNSLAYYVIGKLDESETYYRFFWLWPMALFIAGVLAELIMVVRKERRCVLVLMTLVICVSFSSKPLTNWVNIPENVYQVNSDVIEVSDVLTGMIEGKYVTIIENNNLRNELRQFNAQIVFTETYAMELSYILHGMNYNYPGRFLMKYLHANQCQYVVLEKEKMAVCLLMETAGLECVAESDNYLYYKTERTGTKYALEYIKEVEATVDSLINMEYIAIDGVENPHEIIYIADFGPIENEKIYQDVISEINRLKPACVIINDSMSQNAGWYSAENTSFGQLIVPYYCNDKEFQVIEQDGYKICLIDNLLDVSEETITAFENEKIDATPMILVLSKEISESDELYSQIMAEDSPVVQILTSCKEVYSKTILEDKMVQFATLVDENTMFNIVRVKGKENALR